ncbi:MAG TPA: 16S rRNA (guanine(527)-N(7))-methyltransferase RsmG [Fermentimonas caenicola]|mgnify:CR=1 FL=1|uniref:Ribosomal RNA small subunit methyltransferase G n=1 Tax=Fermentimonas caenicola TaxID=1562970 RepID=A0A098BYR8_9BACT|nr:16S rRNA (guanine(527)-N(7))-methyltransferase RsmG [Lascolabacillus sp.]MBP6174776.1 16S rRNA (guanine(527)-N(7))-methyltransferase RsmG [Fermentimonas sp.]MDI9626718.1 16S rRNA (guanine(527)-N(7))-methyltransferase RsmG [Bacteroidota bacterium]TAH61207.1 MAG: 16S rRNA (guanine(527)-N(7))-methyltransferase RsmG [Fermentimonas caenicola]MBP6197557.1 16S rRNA (guanine(527)-N(7))-methyltransferase RsmG [Fermentimonas sp.]MCK9501872.1 16S rRNA (guanine(527)-N(7))-methyltransferase RsmG [Lascol
MKVIENYFQKLTELQKSQFKALFDLYLDWNNKINVISRKDIENLYLHHVLHSLAIAKYVSFAPGTKVMDVGTGGGFPGIPLAIFFPEVQFLLLDSIGKKVRVAGEIAKAIGLENVEVKHSRAEDEKRKFDFIVSRAVMLLPELVKITNKNISREQNNSIPNGVICLKGGDLTSETKSFKNIVDIVSLSEYFSEPFFQTKKLVYLPVN